MRNLSVGMLSCCWGRWILLLAKCDCFQFLFLLITTEIEQCGMLLGCILCAILLHVMILNET